MKSYVLNEGLKALKKYKKPNQRHYFEIPKKWFKDNWEYSV